MSSIPISRIIAATVLAAAIASGGAALAKAASLEDLVTGQLIESGIPELLDPITSAGRRGWDCRPERAAGAAHWRGAELPAGPEAP